MDMQFSKAAEKNRAFSLCLLIPLLLLLLPGWLISQDAGVNHYSLGKETALVIRNWMVLEDSQSPVSDPASVPGKGWLRLAEYLNRPRPRTGMWWLKADIVLDNGPTTGVLALFPRGFVSAYELYWDGRRIGRNGRIGNSKGAEQAGTLFYIVHLPDSLAVPGAHTLTLRISHQSPSSWDWHRGQIFLGPYEYFLRDINSRQLKFFFLFGIMFLTALFNLFLFFSRGKRPAHLIFFLLCLGIMATFITAFIEVFTPVSTRFIGAQFYLFPLESLLVGILFTAFFVYEFDIPAKKLLFGAVGIHLALYAWHELVRPTSMYERDLTAVVLLLTAPLSVWAVVKKREGSLIALAGIVMAGIAVLAGFNFDIYQPVFLSTVMVFCYSFSIARQFARSERREKSAALRSSRLEIEILKKCINPHFLMNSLTSIIVWLRKDPATAVKLVESLAEEFRMITQVSPLPTIPAVQEVAVCRAHLQIMSIRRGGGFTLDVEGLEEGDRIPPLIFHTLIENGLSHGYENRDEGRFRLVRKSIPGGVRYILGNDSGNPGDSDPSKSGFGLKYVRIRLEEAFPSRWRLFSGPIPGGWEATIDIRDQ